MHAQRNTEKYGLLFLILLAWLSFFANLDGAPLFDEDEGAYTEVTREMLANHDYTTTYLNGRPFFHKPPLFYWLQAACVRLFGQREFAFRLPSALAAVLWLASVYLFTRRYLGKTSAWYAAVFMAGSLQVTLLGKAAIPDALLNLFITLAMFHIYDYYSSHTVPSPSSAGERKPGMTAVRAAFLFMGLGVLSKGPIAVLIPFASSLIFFLLQKQGRTWLRAAVDPPGLALFCLAALPWYILEYRLHGRLFLDEIFLKHNVERFQTAFEGHSGPLYYYLPVLLLGMLPFTAFLLRMFTGLKTLLKGELPRFLFIWFIFVFAFFSLAQTKLHHYVVYGYPPLFILMAMTAERVRRAFHQGIWLLGFLALLAAAPVLVPLAGPLIEDDFARRLLSEVTVYFGREWLLWSILALTAAAGLILWPRFSIRARSAGLAVVFLAFANFQVIPLAGRIMQQPVKEAALLARYRGYRVIAWRFSYPSFNVYYDSITEQRRPGPGEVVITSTRYIDDFEEYTTLYRKHGIVLARLPGP